MLWRPCGTCLAGARGCTKTSSYLVLGHAVADRLFQQRCAVGRQCWGLPGSNSYPRTNARNHGLVYVYFVNDRQEPQSSRAWSHEWVLGWRHHLPRRVPCWSRLQTWIWSGGNVRTMYRVLWSLPTWTGTAVAIPKLWFG
jgi:hypothetical protein